MDKKLFNDASELYKENALVSWVLGVFLALVIAGISLIGLFIPYVAVVLIPFLVLPFLFATQVAFIDTYNKNQLTFTSFFKFFVSFFKPNNYGTYMFARSFLKSLLGFLVVYTLSSIAASITIYLIDKQGTMNMLTVLQDIIFNGEYLESTLEEALGSSYRLYVMFENIVTVSCSISLVLFLLFFISRNSVALYLRMNIPTLPNGLYRDTFNVTISRNRKAFHKDFFSLNWPMFAIYLFTSIALIPLSLMFTTNGAVIASISVASGLALLMFFFPFFFSNQMVLYTKYNNAFKEGSYIITQRMLDMIQRRMDLNEQDKELLSKAYDALNKAKNESEDDNKEEPKEENREEEK